MDDWHDFKGCQTENVAEEIHYCPIFVHKDDNVMLPELHTSNSGGVHRFSVAFASFFNTERGGIDVLKALPDGKRQNTQAPKGGGGTSAAMHASTAGRCQGIYCVYFIAARRRRPGEEGNIPAERAFIGTPGGKLMPVDGGELGARALFRKGMRNLLDVLRAFDAAAN